MDQSTHDVRMTNWLNIISQCQNRPAGISAKQWLAENDVNEKSYYYWLRKIRRETYEHRAELPDVTRTSELSFVEVPLKAPESSDAHNTGANRPGSNDSGCSDQIRPPDAGIIKRYFRVPALQAVAGGASCLKIQPESAG